MGTTVNKILEIAKKEIGVKEYPMNSNKVKYNTAYYNREVSGSAYPWCCTFIWWLFQQAKAPELFYAGGKTASCTMLMNYYKKQKQFKTANPLPGDLVFFNFDKNTADAEHIGIVEAVNNNIIITIEGNTGTTNDANGGAVMRRERRTSVILGYATPAYDTEEKIGWMQDINSSRWWYKHKDGSYTKNGWEKINGIYYYFDNKGWMKTGWIKDGEKYYYCDVDGKMLTGWINKDGSWYYLKPDGSMAESEILTISSSYGNEKYAFSTDGHMLRTNGRGALV